MAKPYRLGVVAVFVNEKNLVLLGKRVDLDVWQFPQGGVDADESTDQALFREVLEEVGNNKFDIVKESPDLINYEFPENASFRLAKKYVGQRQKWYLCKFHHGEQPDLDLAVDKEFEEIKWMPAQEAFQNIIYWKKAAYEKGLRELGVSFEG